MASMTGTATRPGGRSARVRADVHRAVVALLAEGPAESLTMPVIAARAGVHPTTVYRRWRSLAELLASVAGSRFTGDLVVPDTGSLRGDLEQWTAEVVADMQDPDSVALMRATVGAAPQGAHACTDDRLEQLAAMLERDRSRGGRPLDVERVADALLGPIYYRAIVRPSPMDPGWARDLVADLLR